MKLAIKKPLILTTLISITLLSGCGGGGGNQQEAGGRDVAITAGDKVIIEKAMIAAENDWDAYKEVMTMLVDLKGSEKSAVKADFEKYFELADEYTGRNGLLALEDLKDAQIIVLKGLGRFDTGSQAYADQEKSLREIKEKAEVASKRLENMKAELLSVEKNIKARYQ